MPDMKIGFPLHWPPGVARTARRRRSKFKIDGRDGAARGELLHQIKLLGGMDVTISTNVPLRRDGLPYSGGNPEDPGVAVYFDYGPAEAEGHVFACDAWDTVAENMWALAKTVEALRGIERWGSTELMQRAFSAFRQLPPGIALGRAWWDVLGVKPHAPTEDVQEAFTVRAFEVHPDRGGTHEQMAELNAARDSFERERGLAR